MNRRLPRKNSAAAELVHDEVIAYLKNTGQAEALAIAEVIEGSDGWDLELIDSIAGCFQGYAGYVRERICKEAA